MLDIEAPLRQDLALTLLEGSYCDIILKTDVMMSMRILSFDLSSLPVAYTGVSSCWIGMQPSAVSLMSLQKS